MDDTASFRTILKWISISVVSILIMMYVVFQARYLIIGPQIVLTDTPTHLQNERQIFISGSAFNISRLWLNDRQIYTDAQGNFKEALVLENGYTIATLRAEDRYGRGTTVAQPLYYSPSSFADQTAGQPN